MLLEIELPIKKETQVPPIGLGLKGGIASERGKAQIDGGVVIVALPREMKNLRLRVLQGKPKGLEEAEYNVKERGQWGPVNDPNSEDLR